jgi:N-acyl-phosphatidylethanolamine-hydrolysing phospholipase D
VKLTVITGLFFCAIADGVHAQPPTGAAILPTHHTTNGFQNPYIVEKKGKIFKYLMMRYFGDEEFADYEKNAQKIPFQKANITQVQNPADDLQITWIGHATSLIQYRKINILTDPIFSERASPVDFAGPKRHNPPAINITDLPDIDYIVISHNHYDHLDKKTVQQIGSRSTWLVPLGLKAWLVKAGIDKDKVFEFDWWEERQFGVVAVTATPAQHWSSRSLWDRNHSLWASWMLHVADKVIWYSGDTGYNPYQFKEIGEKFPQIDLALISIGAYEPRWFMKDMHINPEEAVQIHLDVHSRHSIAVQWGTFQLTAEPIDDPPLKLQEALIKKNIPTDTFEIIEIGETRVIPSL